jgi:glycine/D-amino acid oxidase-like deaminating enzyme
MRRPARDRYPGIRQVKPMSRWTGRTPAGQTSSVPGIGRELMPFLLAFGPFLATAAAILA